MLLQKKVFLLFFLLVLAGMAFGELPPGERCTIKPVVFVTPEEAQDLPALTRRVYDSSGMISFLTGGVKESRAWELRKNSNAVLAAHAIHSDIARGFIRAEVMAYDDLLRIGNVNQAKNEGCLHKEGKDYIFKDGDIVEFQFSV